MWIAFIGGGLTPDEELVSVAAIVRELPGRVLRPLAWGESEDPDDCRLCDVADHELDTHGQYWEPELYWLLDWHLHTTEGIGLVPYLRCITIYEHARVELLKRRAGVYE
jgi:hypothetical protein